MSPSETRRDLSIAVLGVGGVGGLVAAALARAEIDVTIVVRDESAATLERDGLAVESVVLGDFSTCPRVVTALVEPVDVLIVATKATGLEDALARIQAEPLLVVPLLNGLGHYVPLRERFPGRVAAGTILVESDRPTTGRIVQASRTAQIEIASDEPSLGPRVEALARTLGDAGIPARVESAEAGVVWRKLVRLNALALTTSAHDLPLGDIRSTPELRAELVAVVRETAAVARAEGADELDVDAILARLDADHASQTSSMLRDLRAGRPPELDGISLAVAQVGRAHGVACPTVERLAEVVAARAGHG